MATTTKSSIRVNPELLVVIKFILLIGFEKDWVVKKKKRREVKILNLFCIFSPLVVNLFILKKLLIQLTLEVYEHFNKIISVVVDLTINNNL